ncbi:MAG: transposase [Clostridia bacterium]|nr:transposase [Clostridia bacterium]
MISNDLQPHRGHPAFFRHFSGQKSVLIEINTPPRIVGDVVLIEGATQPDHVHMLVSIPPKLSVSEFMGYLKGKSTLMLFDRHPELVHKEMRRNF